MNSEEESKEEISKKEEIIVLAEKAILKSFDYLGSTKQKRKDILEKALELLGMENTPKNIDNIRKVLKRLVKDDYVIKYGRGKYEKNSAFKFEYVGIPLPKEEELPETSLNQMQGSGAIETSSDNLSESKSVEISSERREAHTLNLKESIKNWIDNFPRPSGVLEDSRFYYMVGQCEQHPLYPDLSNHLPQSGFDVCSRWEQYKNEVKDMESAKKDLLTALEKWVSNIFNGVELNFVKYIDLTGFYDPRAAGLKDFECSIPRLLFSNLLYELDIDFGKLESANEDDYEKINSGLMRNFEIWSMREDRIKILLVSEDDNSVFWGEDRNMELIRLPKDHASSLIQGKDKVISFFKDGPDPLIKNRVEYIFNKFTFLDQERTEIINELERSLYCISFSGNCKYLGV